MNETEYRELLVERDARTLDDRIRRRFRLAPQALGIETPELHWEYDVQLVDLFITGKFIPAMLFAGVVVEIILRDQLRKAGAITTKEEVMFGRLITLAVQHLSEIDGEDEAVLRDLADVRNTIAHALTGEGKGIASWGSPMEEPAFRALEIARQLGQHYYGVAD
ncbi:MAG: hypothetical protein IIC32_04500 [Chloroflexi bacterium]|nr:hypothetical protein [Chloroflexota bacterium]